jgi:rhamnosyltransferase
MLPYGDRFGGAGPNFLRLIRDVSFDGFDMVAFSDQDDIWFEEKLQSAWGDMDKYQADVVSSDVIAFWEGGRRELIKKSYPQRQYDFFFEAAGPGCTYVFSNKAAVSFQAFVRDRFEIVSRVVLHDWLAYAYCRSRGFFWYIQEKPAMMYRQHDSNQVGTNNNLNAYLKRLGLIRKHWYREQVSYIYESVVGESSELILSKKFLLKNFRQLRRRSRDSFVLLVAVFFGFF